MAGALGAGMRRRRRRENAEKNNARILKRAMNYF